MPVQHAWIGAITLALLVLSACSKNEGSPPAPGHKAPAPAEAPSDPDAEQLTRLRVQARDLTDRFQKQLKARLTAAVQSGGPGKAIEVCKLDAPKIAAELPKEQGKPAWSIGRTALKVRNPRNAPTDWQRRGLDHFVAAIAAQPGVDIASLEWDGVIEEDGAKQWRYMRAIPTAGLCLTCHGDKATLPPPVQAKLTELYPDDQATGFAVGDLRGAFVVTTPL